MVVRQLSGLDAEFLAMESDRVFGHFGTLTLLEPTGERRPLDLSRVQDHVASRLPRVPVFRQRLMPVVMGVDQPYWVDDVAFDLARHVRTASLPAPGDVGQLAEAVARIHARPLDRRRPLWELHLFSDLPGGRAAVYFKIHHAVMDGVGSQALLDAMADPEPTDPSLAPPDAGTAAEPPRPARPRRMVAHP